MAEIEQNVHINAPHLLSRGRRISDAVVTGAMWALYSYLWAPLISLFAWLLGFEFAYDVIVRAGGIHSLREVLAVYSIMVGCIFVIVTSWSLVNRFRFVNHNRRKGAKPIGDTEIADFFEIDASQLKTMRDSRVVWVSLSDMGTIEDVEAGALPKRPD